MQHFFCVRIDPAIDDALGGKDLIVSEVSPPPHTCSQVWTVADLQQIKRLR